MQIFTFVKGTRPFHRNCKSSLFQKERVLFTESANLHFCKKDTSFSQKLQIFTFLKRTRPFQKNCKSSLFQKGRVLFTETGNLHFCKKDASFSQKLQMFTFVKRTRPFHRSFTLRLKLCSRPMKTLYRDNFFYIFHIFFPIIWKW